MDVKKHKVSSRRSKMRFKKLTMPRLVLMVDYILLILEYSYYAREHRGFS
jgi:hypothetical protein